MSPSEQLSKHLHEVFQGGNWTSSCFRDQLADVGLDEALKSVNSLNSIATLAYHTGYYIGVLGEVLKGGPLNGTDEHSFKLPEWKTDEAWRQFIASLLENVKEVCLDIKDLPESRLYEDFTDPRYGSWFRNILGIIEHTHYHLGQIALIKKMLRDQ